MIVFSYVKNKTRHFDLNFQLITIKSLFGISCLKQDEVDVTGAESKNKQQLRNMAEMKYLLGKNNSTWFCFSEEKGFYGNPWSEMTKEGKLPFRKSLFC